MKIAVWLRRLSLIAGCALMFCSAPSAQEMAPGKTKIILAPEAAVLSTTHYQAAASNSCTGSSCLVTFPGPGTKKRLNLTRVYCLIQSSNATTKFNYGRVELQDSVNSLLLSQFITDPFSSAAGTHTLNNAIDVQVSSGQHIAVFLGLTAATADFAFCSVSGTLSTLG